jgi:hypothetical protein
MSWPLLQRLALNGTVRSQDLVNVTIQLPPAWAVELFNATVTGSGYINVGLMRQSFWSHKLLRNSDVRLPCCRVFALCSARAAAVLASAPQFRRHCD